MNEQVSLAILAGGASSRFEGTPKLLLHLDDRTLLEHVLASIGSLFNHVLACVKDKQQELNIRSTIPRLPSNVSFLHDEPGGPATGGTINGLRTALAGAPTPWVLVISGDMPLVSPSVVSLLARKGNEHEDVDAVVPRWGNGYLEPTLALYNTGKVLDAVIACLAAGEHQLVRIIWRLTAVVHVPVEAIRLVDPDLACMINVNEPADLDEASGILEKQEKDKNLSRHA